MSISVCVPGITGKMGMEIARLVLLDNTNIRLSSGIARDLSKLNKSNPNIDEEIITSDLNEAISRCDVCVDFTSWSINTFPLSVCYVIHPTPVLS